MDIEAEPILLCNLEQSREKIFGKDQLMKDLI